jgi:hypothetical protein
MKNAVYWDVTPCGSWENQRFGGTCLLHHQCELLVTANVVPSSLILFILMMVAIRSSETSVLSRAERRHIQEEGILLNAIQFVNWKLRYWQIYLTLVRAV